MYIISDVIIYVQPLLYTCDSKTQSLGHSVSWLESRGAGCDDGQQKIACSGFFQNFLP